CAHGFAVSVGRASTAAPSLASQAQLRSRLLPRRRGSLQRPSRQSGASHARRPATPSTGRPALDEAVHAGIAFFLRGFPSVRDQSLETSDAPPCAYRAAIG